MKQHNCRSAIEGQSAESNIINTVRSYINFSICPLIPQEYHSHVF